MHIIDQESYDKLTIKLDYSSITTDIILSYQMYNCTLLLPFLFYYLSSSSLSSCHLECTVKWKIILLKNRLLDRLSQQTSLEKSSTNSLVLGHSSVAKETRSQSGRIPCKPLDHKKWTDTTNFIVWHSLNESECPQQSLPWKSVESEP